MSKRHECQDLERLRQMDNWAYDYHARLGHWPWQAPGASSEDNSLRPEKFFGPHARFRWPDRREAA